MVVCVRGCVYSAYYCAACKGGKAVAAAAAAGGEGAATWQARARGRPVGGGQQLRRGRDTAVLWPVRFLSLSSSFRSVLLSLSLACWLSASVPLPQLHMPRRARERADRANASQGFHCCYYQSGGRKGRVGAERGTMTERKATSAGDRWNGVLLYPAPRFSSHFRLSPLALAPSPPSLSLSLRCYTYTFSVHVYVCTLRLVVHSLSRI